MTHAYQATSYCRDVLNGTVIAGNWIKLAARRHLDDLAKSATGGRFEEDSEEDSGTGGRFGDR